MNLRRVAISALLISLAFAQTGCITALAGAAIRHSQVTAASFEKISFTSPRGAVSERVVAALKALGSVTNGDTQAGEIVGIDSANLYRYTVGLQAAQKGQPTVLSIRVEMIGDWEKVGWTTTQEKSQAFVDSVAASLGTAPVKLTAKATDQE